MDIFYDTIARLFSQDEAGPGPVLGKRKASDASGSSRRQRRRLTAHYTDEHYKNAAFNDEDPYTEDAEDHAEALGLLRRESTRSGQQVIERPSSTTPNIWVPRAVNRTSHANFDTGKIIEGRKILDAKGPGSKTTGSTGQDNKNDSGVSFRPPPKYLTSGRSEDRTLEDFDGDEDVDLDGVPQNARGVAPPVPKLPTHITNMPPTVGSRTLDKVHVWNDGKKTPNTHAKRLVKDLGDNEAKAHIKDDLKEPDYAFMDVEIRDGVWSIMDKLEAFARAFFSEEVCKIETGSLESVFEGLSPETVKIIGCVASGGPSSEAGWHKLFLEDQKRQALVIAIIGNVLVEQVFQHGFFGGSEGQQQEINNIQKRLRNTDGFNRNTEYAKYILGQLNADTGNMPELELPAGFDSHAKEIAGAIFTHLDPLIIDGRLKQNIMPGLFDIVATAGIYSILMHADPHTVYYFVPAHKEDKFKPEHTEAFNKSRMIATNPRQRKVWDPKTTKEEKVRASRDEAINQIILLNGITAYRQGGWETYTSTPYLPAWKAVDGKDTGIRCRILTHNWVYCRWGRARQFRNGKATDVSRIHGAAWKGGFIEFRNVPGVPGSTRAKIPAAETAVQTSRESTQRLTKREKTIPLAPGPSGSRTSRAAGSSRTS
ncbi:hypothetical protein K504DRAFT_144244 [Pleomassaria siparia CBS 279.74]|uniref:Uncharacterized protein n=1 Tax=Pleomassaria siparia CBS 279.74 TaxID=1314801 RepID=A0A6G1KLG4_9PLEO|nr:hypothetical protein K504DRAFT_144244 [Pleomassaria siparia CBS 279.74]